MIRVSFILLFVSLISCGRTGSEFEFQDSFQVNSGETICINTNDCFHFGADSSFCYSIMSYSYENKRTVDTLDYTIYGATLNSFKSQEDSSYVVLLKIEREFHPTYNLYYIKDEKLIKIGELEIFTPCETCDTFDYSIEDIRIFRRDKEIEFDFSKDANYLDTEEGNWNLYKAGTLKLSFNIVAGSLKKVSI